MTAYKYALRICHLMPVRGECNSVVGMSAHESEDEVSLPGWPRKRRVLRLSSDLSQPDPAQIAPTGDSEFSMRRWCMCLCVKEGERYYEQVR